MVPWAGLVGPAGTQRGVVRCAMGALGKHASRLGVAFPLGTGSEYRAAMFRFPLIWLLLAGASAIAQIPLRTTDHEIREVQLTAKATSELLIIDLTIANGWHAYSRDVGGGNPVAIELAADCDFVADGELRLPEAFAGKVGGEARWQLPIKARGAGKDLRVVVWFQICDELECYAPARVEVSGDPRAMSVLLVVDAKDERSARLDALLTDHGCKVAVTLYESVTAQDCDQNDVVLADSKLFGMGAKVREHVLKFPMTPTPIVAVGFFGTELVEAHKVAMTSGYI